MTELEIQQNMIKLGLKVDQLLSSSAVIILQQIGYNYE